MKNLENKLTNGFNSVELEERLEMVHLSALSEEAAASICTDATVVLKPAK